MSYTSTRLLRSRKHNSNNNNSSSSSNADIPSSMSLPLHASASTTMKNVRYFSSSPSSRKSNRMQAIWVVLGVSSLFLGLAGAFALFKTTGNHNRNLLEHIDTGAVDLTALGIQGTIYDVVIAGAGPAGLTAALFASRAGLNVLILGSETGLLSETQHLDNFPSYTGGNGPMWLEATRDQVIHFGANFATPGVLASSLQQEAKSGVYTVTTNSQKAIEQRIHAWTIIVASGASPRHLGLPNENLLWGKTLHNCAICDGHLYLDKTVVVVGGGDSAMDAAILLARYAKHVYLVHRGSQWSGKNQVAIEVAQTTPNIEFLLSQKVHQWELDSTDRLVSATLQSTASGNKEEETRISIDGAFVMIGATPNTEWLKSIVELDDEGLVKLNGLTETSRSGVFAVGEVADNVYKQAITASAAGAQAAIDAERLLREIHGIHKHTTIQSSASSRQDTSSQKMLIHQGKKEEAETTVNCDLTLDDCIRDIINAHPVVIFSKSWCPYCRKALEALAAAGIDKPFVVDLSKDSNAQKVQAILKKMTGRRTVPNVFVGAESIGGGDETSSLQAEGRLGPLLVKAGALEDQNLRESDTKNDDSPCNLIELSCIEDIIRKEPVVMFTLSWCPECKRTLELFRSIGADLPVLIDLDDYKSIQQNIRYNMMEISGRQSVPNLFIGGEWFGGYAKTLQLHNDGKLTLKLQEIGWSINQ